MVTSDTKLVPEEPETFNKAWDNPNATSHMKLWKVFCKVFADTNKQQIWCMTSKSLVPPYCRCMKNKWVFKIKCNGVYKVCLIALRYS